MRWTCIFIGTSPRRVYPRQRQKQGVRPKWKIPAVGLKRGSQPVVFARKTLLGAKRRGHSQPACGWSWPVGCETRSILPAGDGANFHLGKGTSVLYSADVPRYTELGQLAFERLGADPERFDVYRCRVEYSVLPSTVAITFRPAARSGGGGVGA